MYLCIYSISIYCYAPKLILWKALIINGWTRQTHSCLVVLSKESIRACTKVNRWFLIFNVKSRGISNIWGQVCDNNMLTMKSRTLEAFLIHIQTIFLKKHDRNLGHFRYKKLFQVNFSIYHFSIYKIKIAIPVP